ncbi:LuxR C-terminal-related transcriptional regulator [Leifsonia sp. fls2-241-R2A-40a]|uniref:LuxR C-terminal-related transcriptional regulator n=1 Tax=Leifsonia sp. fls2-241-R2A-40a TaxID=3040290 RepID=UPI00254F3C9F|nr:LuxR C-terminal-related transcriptional regulator [Leifsonia sp. fls2-241-R2A-40a]
MSVDPTATLTLYAQPGVARADYLAAALEALSAQFPGESVGWNSFNTVTGAVEMMGTPPEVFGPDAATAAALASLNDHPMVISYMVNGEGMAPRRMSDLISLTDLHRTEAYHQLLHPTGAEYQLTVLSHRATRTAGATWTFNRTSHDFTDNEVELATHVQRMLVLIERTWVATTQVSEESPLTAREAQVLALVGNGFTARAIGYRLGIAESTVHTHLEHAYRKLGVSDRMLAVTTARRQRLIPS